MQRTVTVLDHTQPAGQTKSLVQVTQMCLDNCDPQLL